MTDTEFTPAQADAITHPAAGLSAPRHRTGSARFAAAAVRRDAERLA